MTPNTAATPSDYSGAASGTLTFTGVSAGETQTITINVNGDTIVEANETLTVTLGVPSAAGVSVPAAVSGTISNDDSTTLTISSRSLIEGDAGTSAMVFTVTSSNMVQGGFTVAFGAVIGTATTADYTVVASTLTFQGTAAGETQTIQVNITGETIVEGDETFTVTLNSVTPPVGWSRATSI